MRGGPHDTSPVGTPGGRQNWVDKAGGLPHYIREIAHALIRAGHPKSRAIQLAVAAIQRWARGQGNVSAATRAKAAKALAEWEAKKARAHALAADHQAVDLASTPRRGGNVTPFWRKKKQAKDPAAEGSGDELQAMVKRIRAKKPGLTDRQAMELARLALKRQAGNKKPATTEMAKPVPRYAVVDLATGQTVTVIDLAATPPVERAESRRKLAKKGKALADWSFPVPDVEHLKKAIQAVGRTDPAKRPALARLLWKRAKQLNALNIVKGTWVEKELHGEAA